MLLVSVAAFQKYICWTQRIPQLSVLVFIYLFPPQLTTKLSIRLPPDTDPSLSLRTRRGPALNADDCSLCESPLDLVQDAPL